MCSIGMSSSTTPRLTRVAKAPRRFTRRNYRQAFRFLDEEFKSRCVYSDVHLIFSGGDVAMHIDHFNPKKKRLVEQDYFNLLLASAHCNQKKGQFWPDEHQYTLGIWIINPCREPDYLVHVVECPKTNRLWGKTVTGKFHITKLGLNASHLVEQRRQRHVIRMHLEEYPVTVKNDKQALQAVHLLQKQLAMLPGSIPQEDPPADYVFI